MSDRAGRKTATRSTDGSCSTSRWAWARPRRSAGCAGCSAPQKAGHGGTLDPLATGVLPIALGEATKTVPFVMDGRKEYRFTLRFGEARSTEDAEGEVTATSDARPDRRGDPRARSAAFVGEIEQMPPAFSALKIDGKRAYDLARAGETVDLKPRRVTIERLELLGRPDTDHADFVVGCGKGTYIRSLGPRSGAGPGHRRTPVGAASNGRRALPGGGGHFASQTGGPRAYSARFSGPWPPSRPRWTTSRRWP